MTNAPPFDDASQRSALAPEHYEESKGSSRAPGFSEQASAFLPHPWIDLGRRPLDNVEPTILLEPIPQLKPIKPNSAEPPHLWDHGLKRVFDVAFALSALVLLTPLMVFIALILSFERGSILYVQTRVGRDRARFQCLKFRTMRPNAEDELKTVLQTDAFARAEWALHQKLSHDPRITVMGRFLRESSLDELPQLWNVVRGDMSLVGPRPIIAPESAGYHGDRAYYRNPAFEDYIRTRPGITGLWQVSDRKNTTYGERVRLDRKYARNRTFWLDLKILWRTIWVVLGRSGQ